MVYAAAFGKLGSSVAFAATDRSGCFWKSRRSLRGARTGKMRDKTDLAVGAGNVCFSNAALAAKNTRAVKRPFAATAKAVCSNQNADVGLS